MNEKPDFKDYIFDAFLDYPNLLSNDFISTGIWQIDELLKGGIRRKELGTILAQWQHGKSTILTIIGANCYIKGYKVLHLILEDFWLDIQQSYRNILKDNIEELVKGEFRYLRLMDCVSKTPKLYELEDLINDYKPDVVIIDYAELLQGSYKIGDTAKRHILRENFIELRRLAGKTNTAIWTAHQASVGNSTEGRAASSLRLTPDRISEARSIGATTDILLGFALNDPFDQLIYCTVMKAKHRPRPVQDFFKLAIDFSIPRIWSI